MAEVLEPSPPCSGVVSSQRAACSSLDEAEKDFLEVLNALKGRNCIKGDIPSIDDLLNPAIEQEDVDSEEVDNFSSG